MKDKYKDDHLIYWCLYNESPIYVAFDSAAHWIVVEKLAYSYLFFLHLQLYLLDVLCDFFHFLNQIIPIKCIDLPTYFLCLFAQLLNHLLKLVYLLVLLQHQHIVLLHYQLYIFLHLIWLLIVFVHLLQYWRQCLDIVSVDIVQLFQELFLLHC